MSRQKLPRGLARSGNIVAARFCVSDSARKQVSLLLLGLCLSLEEPSPGACEPPVEDRKQPPPVKPSREPRDRAPRVVPFIGVNVFPRADYAYETHIKLPDGEQLQYNGTESAPGVTLFTGGAMTLPGVLRRI